MNLSTVVTRKSDGLINGEETTEFAQATNFEAVELVGGGSGLKYCKGYFLEIKATVTTPTPKTFTAVDITNTGTGTHTLTATALAGASYKLQVSQDGSTWIDLGVTNNITTTANFIHEKVDPMFPNVRVVTAITAGQISLAQTFKIIGA